MRRTQILLEETQYETLKQRASKEGKSMGGLIRELIETALDSSADDKHEAGASLRDLKGIFRQEGTRGRDHDAYLYGGVE